MRFFHIAASLFAVASFALAGCAADSSDPQTTDQQITQGEGSTADLGRVRPGAGPDLTRLAHEGEPAKGADPRIDYNEIDRNTPEEQKIVKLPVQRKDLAAIAGDPH